MKKKKTYWLWCWGHNSNRTHLHSPEKKFTDFEKMKEYSAKHSYEHKWVGDTYWSDYEKIN